MMRLTERQEKFVQNLFSGMTQREAWIKAGYSDKFRVEWVDSHACRLANNVKVLARLKELRSQAISPLIMSEIKRKEKLSEISSIPVIPKQVRPREIIASIQELNKMDKLYTETPSGYQDNRVINIIVSSERAKELTENVARRLGAIIQETNERTQEKR